MEVATLANKGGQKISDFDTVDIIVKRLLGVTLDEIAKFHGGCRSRRFYATRTGRGAEASVDYAETCG